LAAELLKQTAGIDVLHVPFKGAVAGVTAVLRGHVDLMFATAPAVAAHAKSERLKAIATTSPTRLQALPDVPTMVELGYPELTVRAWNGIVAPGGTPPAVVSRVAAALQKVLAQAPIRDRLRAVGLEAADASDPEAFRQLIEAELDRWGALVRSAGIRAD
jgi:tripartite-type tricarboxylate transporter receptor subunit TctC